MTNSVNILLFAVKSKQTTALTHNLNQSYQQSPFHRLPNTLSPNLSFSLSLSLSLNLSFSLSPNPT
jgi:hypothetical protein